MQSDKVKNWNVKGEGKNSHKQNGFDFVSDLDRFMSLTEASALCTYSQEYLSLLARKGLIGAVKKGRNWVITHRVLFDYIDKNKAELGGNHKGQIAQEEQIRYSVYKNILNSPIGEACKNIYKCASEIKCAKYFKACLGLLKKFVQIMAGKDLRKNIFRVVQKAISLKNNVLFWKRFAVGIIAIVFAVMTFKISPIAAKYYQNDLSIIGIAIELGLVKQFRQAKKSFINTKEIIYDTVKFASEPNFDDVKISIKYLGIGFKELGVKIFNGAIARATDFTEYYNNAIDKGVSVLCSIIEISDNGFITLNNVRESLNFLANENGLDLSINMLANLPNDIFGRTASQLKMLANPLVETYRELAIRSGLLAQYRINPLIANFKQNIINKSHFIKFHNELQPKVAGISESAKNNISEGNELEAGIIGEKNFFTEVANSFSEDIKIVSRAFKDLAYLMNVSSYSFREKLRRVKESSTLFAGLYNRFESGLELFGDLTYKKFEQQLLCMFSSVKLAYENIFREPQEEIGAKKYLTQDEVRQLLGQISQNVTYITNADGTKQAVIAIVGPQGPAGPTGPTGVKGDKGDIGQPGLQGPTGAFGNTTYGSMGNTTVYNSTVVQSLTAVESLAVGKGGIGTGGSLTVAGSVYLGDNTGGDILTVNAPSTFNGNLTVASGNSTTLGGSLAVASGLTVTGNSTFNNNVYIGGMATITAATGNFDTEGNFTIGGTLTVGGSQFGATTTLTATGTNTILTVRQGGTGDILNVFDGNTEVFTILDGGNVGIGTSTPVANLAIQSTQGQTQDLFRIGTSSNTILTTSTDASFFRVAAGGNTTIKGKAINPTWVSEYSSSTPDNLLDDPRAVFVSGDYAYVCVGGRSSLAVINISNPLIPVFISEERGPEPGVSLATPRHVFVSGNYAYIADGGRRSLAIIDISNPADPVWVAEERGPLPGTSLSGAYHVYVSGNYAYLTNSLRDSLAVIDISNPADPVWVAEVRNPGGNNELDGAFAVHVSGNYAYVTTASESDSLVVIDISNPANPVYVAREQGPEANISLDQAYHLFVLGKYAYIVSNERDSLAVIDISNPADPVWVAEERGPLPGTSLDGARWVYVSGNYAYLTNSLRDSLAVIDISNPADPVWVAEVRNPGGNNELDGAFAVHVSGNYAYVVSVLSDSLSIIDISGLTVSNAEIGTLKVSNLSVEANAQFAQGMYIQDALNVGKGAMFGGPVAINVSTSTSIGVSSFRVTATSSVDLIQFVQNGTGKILALYDGGTPSSTISSNLAFGVYDGGYAQLNATSTATALSVRQASTGDILNVFDGNTEVLTMLDGGYFGLGTTTPKSILSVSTLAQTSPTTKLFTVASTTGATLFQVLATGKVGVNTASASAYLHIQGTTEQMRLAYDSSNYTSFTTGSTGDLTIAPSGGDTNITGNLTVSGTQTFTGASTLATTTISATGTNTILTVRQGGTGDILNVFDGNTEVFTILDGGNVGIGSSTPSANLAIHSRAGQTQDLFRIGTSSNTILATTTDASFFKVSAYGDTEIKGRVLNPVLKSVYSAVNTIRGIAIKGQFAYLASWSAGAVEIVDLTDPDNPTQASLFTTSNFSQLRNIKVVGNYAYVPSFSSDSFNIIDISDPYNPVLASQIDTNSGYLDGASDVVVSGNYAYIAAYHRDALIVMDISDPYQPFMVAELRPGGPNGNLNSILNMEISGKYIYASLNENDAVVVIDIGDPANPRYVTSIANPGGNNELDGPQGLFINNNYLYVACEGRSSLAVIDISNPLYPLFVSEERGSVFGTSLQGANSVFVAGNYAYITNAARDSLAIVDVSNPLSPVFVNEFRPGGADGYLNNPFRVLVSGNYAYVVNHTGSSLAIIDISGLTVSNAEIGTLKVDNLSVDSFAQFAQGMYIQDALNVGKGAMFGGPVAINVSTSTSIGVSSFRVTATSSVDLIQFVQNGTGKILALYDGGTPSSTISKNLAFGVYDGGYAVLNATSTATALSVRQASTGDILNVFDGASEVLTMLDGGYFGLGTTTPKSVLSVSTLAQASADTKLLTVASTTGATLFQVLANGKVGVNTASASAYLHVQGTTEQLRLAYDSSNYTSFTTGSTGDLTIAPSGGDTNITGNLTVSGTQTFTGASTLATTTISATGTNTILTVRQGGTGDILNVFDGNTEVFTILDGGNVGIGTTTPAAKLSASSTNNVVAIFDQRGTSDILQLQDAGTNVFRVLDGGTIVLKSGDTIKNNTASSTIISGALNTTGAFDTDSTLTVGSHIILQSGDTIKNTSASSTVISGTVQIGSTTDASQLLLPSSNDAITPTLAFGNGDTGFYESADDTLKIARAGSAVFVLDNNGFYTNYADGALLNQQNPTAVLPGFSFLSDSNTGIGRAGADQLSLIAGGAEVFRLNQVASSVNRLSATSSATGNAVQLGVQGTDTNVSLTVRPQGTGKVGIGTTTPSAFLSVSPATSLGLTDLFRIASTTNATLLNVTSAGKMGLGTLSPSAYLHISATTEQLRLSYSSTAYWSNTVNASGTATVFATGTDPALNWQVRDTMALSVTDVQMTSNVPLQVANSGDVGIAGDIVMSNGTASYISGENPLYVRTYNPSQSVDLTLSAANNGVVVVDDALEIYGTTTIALTQKSANAVLINDHLGTQLFNINNNTTTTLTTFTFGPNNGSVATATGIRIGYGGLCVDNDGKCQASTTGRVSARSYVTAASDVAENYPSLEDLEAGDLVMADPNNNGYIIKTTGEYSNNVIGVVSDEPGIILGAEVDGYPIALVGRIPTKVTSLNGEVNPGDLLTVAPLSGYSMRLNEGDSSKIIGTALETFKGTPTSTTGLISMFINPDYKNGGFATSTFGLITDGQIATNANISDLKLATIKSKGKIEITALPVEVALLQGDTQTFTGNYVFGKDAGTEDLFVLNAKVASDIKFAIGGYYNIGSASSTVANIYAKELNASKLIVAENSEWQNVNADDYGLYLSASSGLAYFGDNVMVGSTASDLEVGLPTYPDFVLNGGDLLVNDDLGIGGDLYVVGNIRVAGAIEFAREGIAQMMDLVGEHLTSGNVIVINASGTAQGIVSNQANSSVILGVIGTSSGAVFGNTTNNNGLSMPVVVSGMSIVNVSAENGPIHKGDKLTTSGAAGFAMLASKPGAGVLGMAMDDMAEGQNQIRVLVDLGTYFTPTAKVITVASSGADFKTITKALDFVSDNSAQNRYIIKVAPGVYSEQVEMKDYVDIVGDGENLVTVESDESPVIMASAQARLEGVTIKSISNSNEPVLVSISGGSPVINNVFFEAKTENPATGISITGSPENVSLNRLAFNSNYAQAITNLASTTVLIMHSDLAEINGTALAVQAGIVKSYFSGYGGVLGDIYVSSGAIIESTGDAYGNVANSGIFLDKTNHGKIESDYIGYGWLAEQTPNEQFIVSISAGEGYINGVKVNTSAFGNIAVNASSTNYIFITDQGEALSTTTQSIGNAILISSVQTDAVSIISISNERSNEITVAKQGGKYRTISSALEAITSASENNRWTIKVSSGVYNEQVVLKPFVDITGSDKDNTTIMAINKPVVRAIHELPQQNATTTIEIGDNIISNLKLTLSGDTTGQAVVNASSTNLILEDVNISWLGSEGVNGAAVEVNGASNVNIIRLNASGMAYGISSNVLNNGTATSTVEISYSNISSTIADIQTINSEDAQVIHELPQLVNIISSYNTLSGAGTNFEIAAGTVISSAHDTYLKYTGEGAFRQNDYFRNNNNTAASLFNIQNVGVNLFNISASGTIAINPQNTTGDSVIINSPTASTTLTVINSGAGFAIKAVGNVIITSATSGIPVALSSAGASLNVGAPGDIINLNVDGVVYNFKENVRRDTMSAYLSAPVSGDKVWGSGNDSWSPPENIIVLGVKVQYNCSDDGVLQMVMRDKIGNAIANLDGYSCGGFYKIEQSDLEYHLTPNDGMYIEVVSASEAITNVTITIEFVYDNR